MGKMLLSCLQAAVMTVQISNINTKSSKQSLAWDHFEIKNAKVRCKFCEAVYKYNMTTTPMTYDLNNVK